MPWFVGVVAVEVAAAVFEVCQGQVIADEDRIVRDVAGGEALLDLRPHCGVKPEVLIALFRSHVDQSDVPFHDAPASLESP